jgi:prophage antirepressor-like protein
MFMEEQVLVQCFDGIRGYEKEGVAHLHIEDVARGLGFTRIAESGNEVVRWDRVNGYLNDLKFVPTSGHGENSHDYYIPENIFYRLCMKAKNDVAEAFQTKVADEIIPSIRRHGVFATNDFIQRSISDPDWAISLLQQMKFEREQKELALKQRDEAVRTKYLFVEGRDAQMCGKVGGLTNSNNDLRRKNVRLECKNTELTNINKELTKENDLMKDEAGRGKNYKQVKNIKWLKDYFYERKSNFYSQCGKVLTNLSKELGVEPLIYECNEYNVKCYHISVIEEFKQRLDSGVIYSLLKNYYREREDYNNSSDLPL